ncbi:ROK family protein, partial [Patescibacteria group bacterium]|nr:ROK family protein [Patescibacteria group bacterium]
MYLLFDIGGTKMRLAVSRDGRPLGKVKIVQTPKDFLQGMKLFAEITHELTKGKKIKIAVGGIAGVMDKERTKVVRGNIKWQNKPLKREMERRIGVPVLIENDAALAGLGEAVFGAGRGHSIVVYFTVSTGVGGAKIVDKQIVESAMGFEPGFQIIDYKHPKRVLQNYVSGTALQARYKTHPSKITNPKIWDDKAKLLAGSPLNAISFLKLQSMSA